MEGDHCVGNFVSGELRLYTVTSPFMNPVMLVKYEKCVGFGTVGCNIAACIKGAIEGG